MEINNSLNILRKVPIFAHLEEGELAKIASTVIYRRFRKGSIIFGEGDPGDFICFVKSGRVKIAKLTEDGREQILHFLQDGDLFGEVVLFDGGNYPATAEVLEASEIGMLRNLDLDNVIRSNTGIAVKLIKVLNRRLREAQTKVRDLALKDTFTRTVSLLLKMAGEGGVEKDGAIHIGVELSRQELANLIGTSRETVTRILSDLNRQKIIHLDGKGITILNKQKLSRLIY